MAATGVASTASSVPVMDVDPSAGRRAEGAARVEAEVPTARTAAAPTEQGKGVVKTPMSTGGVDGGGASRREEEEERGRKAAPISRSPIPEYDIYSYSNTSFQAERRRRGLLDVARADMDRVNLERDFRTKNASFDDAKAAHNTLHRRWVESTMTLEAASNASNVYFDAVDRAQQKHKAACRDRQAAELGVIEGTKKSAFAQTNLRKTKEAFHAAKQQAAAYFKANAARVAVKASGACEIGGEHHDDAGDSSQGPPGNSRKRAHSKLDEEPPSCAMVPTRTITCDRNHTAEAKLIGGCGSRDGEGTRREEMHRPAKSRSTTGIHALSQEDERHSHAKGLEAQHKIRARTALQAADAVAKAPAFASEVKEGRTDKMPQDSSSTPTLEVGLGVVASALAVAGRKMNSAIESARRASADLDSAEAVHLPGAVRTEAEAALAFQNAVNNARPYVSWVNTEVARQQNLNTWCGELLGAASGAWDARETARKKLNKAGDRLAMANRVLNSFSRGDKVDISRHALFKVVVEDQRQRQPEMQPPYVANSGGGGRGGGCSDGSRGGGSLAGAGPGAGPAVSSGGAPHFLGSREAPATCARSADAQQFFSVVQQV